MSKGIVYVAGPMSGIEDLNFNAFNLEAYRLSLLGYEVVNPAEINPDKSTPWRKCMQNDVAALVLCDAISLLPGWENSRGATLEHDIATRMGHGIYNAGELMGEDVHV